MASDLSKYLGNLVAQWLTGVNAMGTPPTDVYLALFNGDPKGAGTEITTSVRVAGRLAVSWDAIVAGTDNNIANDAVVDFGDSANAVTLTHVCAVDAPTGGNKLASRLVPGGTIAVAAGTGVKFNVGDVSFTIGS